ncbi:MAG: recombinase zinc beta ribbon domain-containing protein [Rhizobiales bacterium]|nr:recombinase zinc beta ribbon domain-containing protein [Hyphomicrobiales bacterium]
MPQLAIVEFEVFAAAQERRKMTCQVRLTQRRRPKHIFSGLVLCGCCGASMIMTNQLRLACSARTNRRTCDNARTITLSEVENRVLRALQKRLLAPEIVAEAVEAYRAERSRLTAERAKAARQHAREVAEIDRKIARVIDIIESKDHSREEARVLGGRIAELERARTALLARTPAPIEDEMLALHPRAAERYRQKVEQSRAALTKGDEAGREAVGLVRELVTKIIVMPTPKGEALHLAVEGDLAVMLEQERSTNEKSVSMVPPPRLERGTSRSTI